MINILNKKTFPQIIELLVQQKRIPYIDAIILWCEENDFELEDISTIINMNIKEKIEAEAQALNYMKSKSKLPI